MSITLEQIILDAKLVSSRLKDREAFGDMLLVETESVNKQLESMRQFQEDFNELNNVARDKSNTQFINKLNQELPHMRKIQAENRELRASLEDHQRVLEHIMQKYRELSEIKVLNNSKIECNQENVDELYRIIINRTEKINEMAAVMQKSAIIDDDSVAKEQEHLRKLMVENKGLREIIRISQHYGSFVPNVEDKGIQTDDDIGMIKEETLTSSNKSDDEESKDIKTEKILGTNTEKTITSSSSSTSSSNKTTASS